MIVRKRVVVQGRVQGVFFRASLQREAELRDVHGWARNRGDGNVEAVLEGERTAVDAVVRWCHDGPPRAAVDSLEITSEEPQGETRFAVR
ncbi:MAG TPA: acylphosphatase [Acidimicrobiales bacterium]|nr:acylphosphatase [Acidimicrobiales bacterium]